MIGKLFKWTLLLLVLALTAAAAILEVGARRSLDQNFDYTAASAKLPLFHPDHPDGLVRIQANNLEFRARIAGFDDATADKPAVILLHGFPATSAMWQDLIPLLDAAGYRVVAPDQRGYSPGARPAGAEQYTVTQLVADALAIADATGIERFHLVGHDWGAIVGWSVVINHPQRVVSWISLSIPHPTAFGDAVANDPDQSKRSRYFALFMSPWLPERLFAFNDLGALQDIYASAPAAQQQEYLALFAEPGALTGAFNWYRALRIGPGDSGIKPSPIMTPTRFIWGVNDFAVARTGVDAQQQYMSGPFEIVELDAGHWLLREQPQPTLAAIMQHIGKYTRQRSDQGSTGQH